MLKERKELVMEIKLPRRLVHSFRNNSDRTYLHSVLPATVESVHQ